jgi:hypothetical protein
MRPLAVAVFDDCDVFAMETLLGNGTMPDTVVTTQ